MALFGDVLKRPYGRGLCFDPFLVGDEAWHDVATDQMFCRLGLGGAQRVVRLDPPLTQDELKRHFKPVRIDGHVARLAMQDSPSWFRRFMDEVHEQVEWMGWGVRCERALNDPEPGFDANGAPI